MMILYKYFLHTFVPRIRIRNQGNPDPDPGKNTRYVRIRNSAVVFVPYFLPDRIKEVIISRWSGQNYGTPRKKMDPMITDQSAINNNVQYNNILTQQSFVKKKKEMILAYVIRQFINIPCSCNYMIWKWLN